MLNPIRGRAHHRGLHGHQHISRQRRTALIMIVTGALRVVVWTVAMALMLLHFVLPHVGWLTGYYHVCQAVAFVTFLSLYCNWTSDLAGTIAAVSALFAADSHHDSEQTRASLAIDTTQLDADIAQLAALRPGPKAQQLATAIRQRIGAQP